MEAGRIGGITQKNRDFKEPISKEEPLRRGSFAFAKNL